MMFTKEQVLKRINEQIDREIESALLFGGRPPIREPGVIELEKGKDYRHEPEEGNSTRQGEAGAVPQIESVRPIVSQQQELLLLPTKQDPRNNETRDNRKGENER